MFQLFDYYACNGACIFFLSVFQSLAVGWAFGGSQTPHILVVLSNYFVNSITFTTCLYVVHIFWGTVFIWFVSLSIVKTSIRHQCPCAIVDKTELKILIKKEV